LRRLSDAPEFAHAQSRDRARLKGRGNMAIPALENPLLAH
jgi:hypothetical protein